MGRQQRTTGLKLVREAEGLRVIQSIRDEYALVIQHECDHLEALDPFMNCAIG